MSPLKPVGAEQRKTVGFPGVTGQRFVSEPAASARGHHNAHPGAIEVDQDFARLVSHHSPDRNRKCHVRGAFAMFGVTLTR